MVFRSLMYMLTLIMDFFTILGIPNGDKDLEIILLPKYSSWMASKIGALQMDFQTKRKSRQAEDDGRTYSLDRAPGERESSLGL
jgi:hypothetical protein